MTRTGETRVKVCAGLPMIYGMTRTQPYTVLERQNYWRIIDGRYYRQTIVRRADGALRIYLLPDGKVGAA